MDVLAVVGGILSVSWLAWSMWKHLSRVERIEKTLDFHDKQITNLRTWVNYHEEGKGKG